MCNCPQLCSIWRWGPIFSICHPVEMVTTARKVRSRWLATGRSICCYARQTRRCIKHRCIRQPRGKSKSTENAIRHGPSSEDLKRKQRMTRPSRKEADGPEQHIMQADVSSGEASPDLADVSLPTCSPLHEALALAAASSE